MNLLALLNLTIKSIFDIRNGLSPIDRNIQTAINWLCSAQDSQHDGGVSLRYSLVKGWDSSYPETTGYIIPNFITYAINTNDENYITRAINMANWELSIQKSDGSFKGGSVTSEYDSFVFDTGQVIFGLIAIYKYTNDKIYLEAAIEAANWLVSVQDSDGKWSKHTFHSIPHTYYTRVAWALAELGKYLNNDDYIYSACNNIDWAITQQTENGWFNQCGFTQQKHSAPYTHTIAYTIEGILETGALLGRNDFIDAVKKSASALIEIMHKDGFYYGTYNREWNSDAKYSCLTGNAQIALIFLRLYEIFNDKVYFEYGTKLNTFLRQLQYVSKSRDLNGAIGGSYPIWGDYQRFAFPNWATKFFIDSLLLEKKLSKIN